MCVRCERLEEEVAYLKGELRLQLDVERIGWLMINLRLTRQQAELMDVLASAKGAARTRERIEAALPQRFVDERQGPKVVDVIVSRIRSKLGRDVIENLHGHGFRLTAYGLALCSSASPVAA